MLVNKAVKFGGPRVPDWPSNDVAPGVGRLEHQQASR